MTMTDILVVDDEKNIRESLVDLLESEGYGVRTAADGAAALEAYAQRRPDLMVLDVMMPKKSGYDVCREIRKTDLRLPIIMLTAKTQEVDEVLGLERGASDYVTKPFSIQALLARVAAHLRQADAYSAAERDARGCAEPEEVVFAFGSHTVYPERYRLVDARKREQDLTQREIDVLRYLAERQGKVASRIDIWEEFWPDDVETSRVVDMLIMGLRKKLGKDGALIEAVRGVGYRYVG